MLYKPKTFNLVKDYFIAKQRSENTLYLKYNRKELQLKILH